MIAEGVTLVGMRSVEDAPSGSIGEFKRRHYAK